ncbi:MAG: hypothetical protein QG574_3019, partial [Cyanobacteriota bacterium erpe_2018_sw_21hr_WHONDRS-SW48-000092_B_bin.40]|nr:hypothetical protein [Cyanobacteriota bacterium erpe_2018_sw_21hr_WHONDRS-SW48-000092_B_bin.40]
CALPIFSIFENDGLTVSIGAKMTKMNDELAVSL